MTITSNIEVTEDKQLTSSVPYIGPDIITVVRDPKNTLGKQFTKNPDGTIGKKSAVSVSFATAVMHQVETHAELAQLLREVGNDPNSAIINARFDGIEVGEAFIILSEREIEARLGIPRSDRSKQAGVHLLIHEGKEYKAVGRFKENVRPSSWQFFDRDIDSHTPAQYASLTHEEWLAAINKFCPGISDVSFCHVGSTSSRVLNDGKPVGDGNGHTWVKFSDPADVERFRTAVMITAAQAEMTWLKPRFSRSESDKVVGQSLTTIIDPSVFTPGRLIFVGQPVAADGLTIEPISATVHLGTQDAFDSASVTLPDAAAVREITRKAGVEMDVSQSSDGLRITTHDLTLGTEIETEDYGVLTVREFLERGINTKVRCQTPFRESSSYAAIIKIGREGTPFVFDVGTSTTHWLNDDESKEIQFIAANGLVQRLLIKAVEDCGAPFEPDAIEALRTIQNVKPADFQRIRAALKKSNKGISVVNLDKAMKLAATETVVVAQTHHGYALDVVDKFTVNDWRPVGYEGTLFRVDRASNLWVEVPFDAIVHQVTGNHDAKENCERGSDYKAISQHVISISTNDEYFADAAVGLATPGGFYQIKGGQIEVSPLVPEHRQRVMIDVTPRDMPTPLFDKFLHDTFQSITPDEELAQIALVQEITGAIMVGIAHKYQKAVLYYDPFGRAGKGTLEGIQRWLVPPAFHSAVSPFKWDSEYYLASLAGARLNVVGELPDDKPIPAAAFKTVTGGDLLTGRHPTHRPISFKNQAAHVFMSNHLINTTDHSEAFFARWEIVEFPNSRLVSGLPLDTDLAANIVAAELPGIAFWALQGAARLIENGAYSKSSAHDRLMTQWRRRTNSLDEFIFECCNLNADETTNRSKFYLAYTLWCKDSGRKPFAKSKVKDLLVHNIVHGIKHASLDGYEVFRGIQLKDGVAAEPHSDDLVGAGRRTAQMVSGNPNSPDSVGKVDF
ncbi:MAG: phage/plasmid primase, P4 family [Gallionella sp.]|jgi:putative DNA primase/helicase